MKEIMRFYTNQIDILSLKGMSLKGMREVAIMEIE